MKLDQRDVANSFVKVDPKKTVDSSGSEKLQMEALAELKADPCLYSLIHDEFKLTYAQAKTALAPLLDYQSDLDYCAHCPGFDLCTKPTPHFQMYLTYEDGLVEQKYRRCPLGEERLAYQNAFLCRDFPLVWMKKRLQRDVERTAVKTPVLRSCTELLSRKQGQGLYLTGKRRSGRSFVLACLCNDFAFKKITPIAFCDTASFVEKMKNLFFEDKNAFGKQMEAYSSCRLLVFDDFGNEGKDKTGYGYANILFPLLNARAKAGLITCFSSDFTMEEIASMYQPSIGAPRAKQLRYLLEDLCGQEKDITSLDLHA